jgi:DNA-binding Lrp family transcriptional regulator
MSDIDRGDMPLMDNTDKVLLNRIQSDFPITSRPYNSIGDDLGIPETEVMDRLIRLKNMGIIRRIGGNFVPGKLGFVSTLCAAHVPEEKIGEFAQIVNQFTGVTHNYQRDNRYNVWFTFIAPSREKIIENLQIISEQSGVVEIIDLPATRVYKIRAQFDLE